MKTFACFIKTFMENLRDWKILILVLVFAPFFIYLMYMYMGNSGSSVYNVIVINKDPKGVFSRELIDAWESIKTEEGKSVLRIKMVADSATGKKKIKNKKKQKARDTKKL